MYKSLTRGTIIDIIVKNKKRIMYSITLRRLIDTEFWWDNWFPFPCSWYCYLIFRPMRSSPFFSWDTKEKIWSLIFLPDQFITQWKFLYREKYRLLKSLLSWFALHWRRYITSLSTILLANGAFCQPILERIICAFVSQHIVCHARFFDSFSVTET